MIFPRKKDLKLDSHGEDTWGMKSNFNPCSPSPMWQDFAMEGALLVEVEKEDVRE